ncbi:MAG: family 78 glycoside hydrolase catalytic domain [Oscillospiraceae bacterium]|nr:family 78 glycoside hydrolase catalytic domain [Oscillospiraceae bacterium]
MQDPTGAAAFTLEWDPVADDGIDPGTYDIYSFWMQATGQSPTPSATRNYTINYMDRAGVDLFINYYDTEFFTGSFRDTIINSGRGEMYMDSLEISATNGFQFWGYSMLDEFEARRGYDITPYLPFIVKSGVRFINYGAKLLDDQGNDDRVTLDKIRNDLYETMTDMYIYNMLIPLKTYLNDAMNMTTRAEITYGQNFEISRPAVGVDHVETEQYEFGNQIDSFRNLAGASHVYGKRLSSETGAGFANHVHPQFQFMQMINTQYASGINHIQFHGYSSIEGADDNGAANPGTYWPGHEGMYARHSLRLGPRQPGYRFYDDWMPMLARTQKILQLGKVQMDLAVLRTDFLHDQLPCEGLFDYMRHDRAKYLKDLSLQRAGYTYDYFAPAILEELKASGETLYSHAEGLIPDNAGYQAVILYQEGLRVESAEVLLELAKQGLPIIIINGLTEDLWCGRASGAEKHRTRTHEKAAVYSLSLGRTDAELALVMDEMKLLNNVVEIDANVDLNADSLDPDYEKNYVTGKTGLLEQLQDMNILPRAEFGTSNDDFLTLTRRTDNELYMYVYNFKCDEDYYGVPTGAAPKSTVTMSLDAVGKPYRYDPWTTEMTEVAQYKIEDGRTVFDVTLETGATAYYILNLQDSGNGIHAVSSDADSVLLVNGNLAVRATESGEYTTSLSNGETIVQGITSPDNISLSAWDLVVESWDAGDKVIISEDRGKGYTTKEVYYETKKANIDVGPTALIPWMDIPDVGETVSGLGFYTTSFTLPSDWSVNNGAYLDIESTSGNLGAVYVNGEKARALDFLVRKLDISDLLQPGKNDIRVEVSSQLGNVVKSRGYAFGTRPAGTDVTVDYKNYGMVGEVNLITYTVAEIEPTYPASVYGLTVNYKTYPLGIDKDNVAFGWKMASEVTGEGQKNYQIVVREGSASGSIVWDSGKIASGLSVAIPYGGNQLKVETRYYWTVTVETVKGETCSGSGWFETGTDWSVGGAEWITIPDFTNSVNGILFRTEQALTGSDVTSARLYMTALGAYDAYINGEKALLNGQNVMMAPGAGEAYLSLTYQAYDVTDYIYGNRVTLGALVGKGWYGSGKGGGFDNTAIGSSGLRELCILGKLVIEYADGSQQIIGTNTSDWLVSSTTPLGANAIVSGETYNGITAKEIAGWNQNGFDVSDSTTWQTPQGNLTYIGELRANDDSLVYDYKTMPFIDAYVYNTSDIIPGEQSSNQYGAVAGEIHYSFGELIPLKTGDILVLDFGQNCASVPEILISGPEGTTLTIQPGESLSDGDTFSGGGWPTFGDPTGYASGEVFPGVVAGKWTYILGGSSASTPEYYKPQFHFGGHRYLQLTATADIVVHKANNVAVSSVGAETVTFDSSNWMLNQFVENSKWSQVSNYNSVPTDCPTREYTGWTGDAQVFAETALYNFDSTALFKHYNVLMQEHCAVQGSYDTSLPSQSTREADEVVGWSDVGVIFPWQYYMQTGDISMMKYSWDSMNIYVDKLNSGTDFSDPNTDKFKHGYTAPITWGDHNNKDQAPRWDFLRAIYIYYDNLLLVKMAEVLGNDAGVAKYTPFVEAGRNYIIKRYLDSNGNVLSGSKDPADRMQMANEGNAVDNAQTALAYMILLELYDEPWQLQTMAANLIKSVRNENQTVSTNRGENTLSVGFLGAHTLMPALGKSGQIDTAYALMTNTAPYGLSYSIASPPVAATSSWEVWALWEEGTGYKSGESQNHYAYGAPALWLYQYALGIQRDEDQPGFKHFILQPQPYQALSFANGSYDSYYGTIKSGWTTANGKVSSYSCVVPANTTATLYLPATLTTAPAGATVVGSMIHNGLNCTKIELESGAYSFTGLTATVERATVFFDANGGSTVSPITKNLGESVTAAEAAATRSGYNLEGWYTSSAFTPSTKVAFPYTINGNMTLYANWTQIATPTPTLPPPKGNYGGSQGKGLSSAPPTPAPTPTPTQSEAPGGEPGEAPGSEPTPAPTSGQSTKPQSMMADITPDYWAAEFIDGLVALGIVDGYPMPDGSREYRPENEITRLEMAKLIVASLDLELIYDYDGSDTFADWDSVQEWGGPYMAAAIEAGIVLGSAEEGGLYLNPDNNIIREEMIAMCVRALGAEVPGGGECSAPGFDAVSEWAMDDVAFAVENGMINLRQGNVAPAANATRAEAAMILYKLIEYLGL